MRSAISLFAADLVCRGRSHVQDLAAYRKDRLGLAVPGLLGRPAGAVALHDEELGSRWIVIGAIGELAGQAELARGGCGLALHLALGPALQPLVHPIEHEAEERSPPVHMVGEEMIEMVAYGGLYERAASGLVSLSLVWLWNCGSRMKTESMISAPDTTSSP
jgi:hypothetical protein